MEEIRETALAYYCTLSEGQKKKVKSLFEEMDSNGDGRVTLSEFEEKIKKVGLSCDIPKKSSVFKEIFKQNTKSFFKELDQDGDGTLDFEEFNTLYYLLKSGRLLFCDGHDCQVFLTGLFFCCPECLRDPGRSFTLCSACFRNKNHKHDHFGLLDNYALLMSSKVVPPKRDVKKAFEALDLTTRVLDLACACTIM